jgi:hypothetical protein
MDSFQHFHEAVNVTSVLAPPPSGLPCGELA